MKTGDVKYTPICQTKEQNLIKCDSQLASSFQDMKIKSVKPGHYLQKVLHLPKSSQSVPMLDEGFKSDEVRFKTWPEKKDKDPDSPVHNTPVPFETIAHSLPIAYSPVTKKIHLIDNSKVEKRSVNTEASSFSSTVSSLSDASPSNGELPHSSDFSESCSTSLITPESNEEVKPKKKGLSGIFSRTVFNWKSKDAESWNFFGKLTNGHIDSSLEDSCRESGELGSTGLIQLERPSWLPAKSKQEQEHHVNEHEKIISSARKKKIKESKQRKKLLQTQLKAEEEIANSSKVWIQEILPKWSQIKDQKKTLDLWWQGIPPCVRGKLWRLAISNDLNVTHDLYEICVARSLEKSDDVDKESSVESIQLDINRTFPHLCIFQKKGPYYEMLHSLLAAYVCYRPDVGYVQGMSFIAAILILNMDAPDAFVCFANLLNRPCHRAFYNLDQSLMESYYAAFQDLLKENVPSLFEHLKISKLSPDLYLLDWVYTIYAKAMPLDVASRVWDVFLRDGEQFLFRTAIGVLKLYQEQLMSMDFLRGSQFLTRLPEDLNSDLLFKMISSVKMSIGKRNFQQILFSYTHQDL